MKQDIEYNETLASSIGLLVSGEISIPHPERNYEEYKIAGRDGSLMESDGTYKDIQIKIPFNYAEYGTWGDTYGAAKKWLNRSGSSKLKFLRRNGFFYKVKKVIVGSEIRTVQNAAKFEATFVCDPYTYLENGLIEITSGNIYNPEELSHPIYKITGNGLCELSANGKTMIATVGQNLTIDTDKMVAYRTDGDMVNASVKGDYEDLYLLPGENTVSITDGFEVKIIPNWRCL